MKHRTADAGVERAHQVMQHHARTFSAAAAWLAPHTYDAIASVYLFCRTVDDLADEDADDEALAAIQAELRGEVSPSPVVEQMLALRQHGVPMDAAVDLVEGCRQDLASTVRIADQAEVVRYGYLVAGTVGRIVSPLLGVDDPRAEPFAVDLGIGMQLSNIARDVGEDAERDRVYLPETWLEEAGLTDRDVIDGGRDDEVAKVVQRLLDLAEVYYASSDAGLRYLPARARLAVCLASRRYRGIGRKVRSRGSEAVRSRTILGWFERARFLVAAPLVALTSPRGRDMVHDAELHQALDWGMA